MRSNRVVAGAVAAAALTVGLGIAPRVAFAAEISDGPLSDGAAQSALAETSPVQISRDESAQDCGTKVEAQVTDSSENAPSDDRGLSVPNPGQVAADSGKNDSASSGSSNSVDDSDRDAASADGDHAKIDSAPVEAADQVIKKAEQEWKKTEAPKPPVAEGTYAIETGTAYDQMVDISCGGKNNGANVQTYASNNTAAQRWGLDYDEAHGWYTIYRSDTNGKKVLDVCGANASNGANVQLYDYNGTKAQHWYLEKSSVDGYFMIVSALSNGQKKLVLDVSAGLARSGANLQLWQANGSAAQRFAFLSGRAGSYDSYIEDGAYFLTSAGGSKKVADVTGASTSNGANVQLYGSNSTNAQRFYFERDAEGYYTVTCTGTGKVLDVDSAGIAPGTNVRQWDSNGTGAQKWALRKNSDGSFSLLSKGTGLALDVQWGNYANGANLWGWRDTGAQSQRFYLTKTSMLSEGIYEISALDRPNLSLDISCCSNSDGGKLQLYSSNGTLAQRFELVSANGAYRLRTAASGGWLSANGGAESQVVQRGNSSTKASDSDTWDFSWKGGFYSLVNKATGLMLDMRGGQRSDGTAAQLWYSNGTNSQHFLFKAAQLISDGFQSLGNAVGGFLGIDSGKFEDGANVNLGSYGGRLDQKFKIQMSGGSYVITSALTGKAVDVSCDGKTEGTNIWQYASNGSAAQKWRAQIADGGYVVFIGEGSGLALGASHNNAQLVNQAAAKRAASWKLTPVQFSASERVERYVQWMLGIAADDSHGYDQQYRWGERGDYDCSSLVISALRFAGFSTGGASYTGNMCDELTAHGFRWITDFSDLRRGDILLNEVHHTAVFLGEGQLVHASGNENGGAIGGQPGDQTGREICVRSYYWRPWDGFLRYVG